MVRAIDPSNVWKNRKIAGPGNQTEGREEKSFYHGIHRIHGWARGSGKEKGAKRRGLQNHGQQNHFYDWNVGQTLLSAILSADRSVCATIKTDRMVSCGWCRPAALSGREGKNFTTEYTEYTDESGRVLNRRARRQ